MSTLSLTLAPFQPSSKQSQNKQSFFFYKRTFKMCTPPFVCFGSPLTEVQVTQRHSPPQVDGDLGLDQIG